MATERPRRARPRSRAALVALVSAVAVMALIAGCGSDSKANAPDTGATGSTSASEAGPTGTLAPPTQLEGTAVTIKAIDNDFEPKHAVVKAGTAVTFDNTGRNVHDVVATDPSAFDFSIPSDDFGPGAKKTFTFDKPGTYHYYCSLHATATAGSMRGVITVEP